MRTQLQMFAHCLKHKKTTCIANLGCHLAYHGFSILVKYLGISGLFEEQPTSSVFVSHQISTSQSVVIFSRNKSAPATSHN